MFVGYHTFINIMSHLEFFLSEDQLSIHVVNDASQFRFVIVHDLNTLQNFHLDVEELCNIVISMMDQEANPANHPDDHALGGRLNPINVDENLNDVHVNEVQDISFTPVDFVLESDEES